jgi:pyridoxamine 5'-phosphate oxidase
MADLRALIDRLNDAMARAEKAGAALTNGMCLATVGADGRPHTRTVLLKGADERGFVFYTNLGSSKARELDSNPHASLCFWWSVIEEQVRIEGTVERVSDDEADEYFASRPRGSQLGAWASRQSETLVSRAQLLKEFGKCALKFHVKKIPRPEFWGGYRLVPDRVEFWCSREDRLHDRTEYALEDGRWVKRLLYP